MIYLLDYANKESLSINLNKIIDKSLNKICKQTFVTFLADCMIGIIKKYGNKFRFNDNEKGLISIIHFTSALKVRLANDDKHQEYFESSENKIHNSIEIPNNELKKFLLNCKFDKIEGKFIVKKLSRI